MPVAIALAVAYLIFQPSSTDLAAQTFRTDLFGDQGFAIWNDAWYSGFHLPGYSLLSPMLGSLVGERLLGAISVVLAAWAFERIVKRHYDHGARWACLLFGFGVATNLYTGRLTYALGIAIGMLALLAIDRRERIPAGIAAALTSAASPVAGLFLAVAAAAMFLRGRRRDGVILALPALLVIALFSLGFPTVGTEPFVFSTFFWVPFSVGIAMILLPGEAPVLRIGALLYLVMCVILFAIGTPVGGNATRLASVFAPALFALAIPDARRPWLVGLAILPVLYWSIQAPVRDVARAAGDPSVEASYYEPLLAELDDVAPIAPFRVEVPPSRERWEAVYVAEHYAMARGWLRQLESDDFDLFQDDNLTSASYRQWLDDRAVAFVAVSDAYPDYLAEDEKALIARGLPYLHEIWSSEHWKLYRVDHPKPLVDPPAQVDQLGPNSLVIRSLRPGDYPVRVSSSRWWHVTSGDGCARSEDGRLVVHLDAPGQVSLEADLSLAGILGGHGRC
jgi:hypothetical protein